MLLCRRKADIKLKIKIDLHTHCLEATGDPVPKISTVRNIVEQIKKRGLDGIAVTEHYTKDFGFWLQIYYDNPVSRPI